MTGKLKNLYIGEFPPPFGGVSTKNELLKKHIYNSGDTVFINLYDYKSNPLKLPVFFQNLAKAKKSFWNIYIGVGSQPRLKYILLLISLIGKDELLGRTNIYVMGGTLEAYCAADKLLIKLLKKVKYVYVELQRIIDGLNRMGITNTFLLPNCRDGKSAVPPHERTANTPIRLLFFSTVNREKGVPYLFEMADILHQKHVNFCLDIYGELDENYEEDFMHAIHTHADCHYNGVFDAVNNNLYEKISQYDLLLLPTKWKGESCIGILIEAKMAGIPSIVSDHNYNSEIIKDGKEGFVVKDDFGKNFAEVITHIYNTPSLYNILAKQAYDSKKYYDIHLYADLIKEHCAAGGDS